MQWPPLIYNPKLKPRESSAMHFTREDSQANLIRALESERVKVGETWYGDSIIITTDRIVTDWEPADPTRLSLEELAPAIALEPDILLVGSHVTLPDVDLITALAEQGIGLEMMGMAAACRTYNVLVHEYRRVAAALIRSP